MNKDSFLFVDAVHDISTLGAFNVIDKLDIVDKIQVKWLTYFDQNHYVISVFSTVHFKHWLGGNGPVYYDGRSSFKMRHDRH